MFEPVPGEIAGDDIEDMALWYERQIALLRARRFEELDVANLIEELEYQVKKDRREIRSRLRLLIMHLLKCQYQPQRTSRSWYKTIAMQRMEIEDALEVSPSFGPTLMQVAEREYPRAVRVAAQETRLALDTFPSTNPYTRAQLLDHDYFGA